MDKVTFIYGSARDSSTRALRRTVFPRETQIRIGPWIIRPAKRLAVEFTRLLPHLDALIEKINHGVIQLQRADTSVISVEEIRAAAAGASPALPTPPLAATPPPDLGAVAIPQAPAPGPAETAPIPAVLEEPAEDSSEQMDFSGGSEEAAPAKELPESWRQLTAKELGALCLEHSIPTTKTTKTALVAAIEAWLGGE